MQAVIRHKGAFWKVRKLAIESEEMAQDRAWYIAKTIGANDATPQEMESLSRQWANEKYFQMKYDTNSSSTDDVTE